MSEEAPRVRPTRTVEIVLPNDIDDPLLPSGGNAYDRRICQEFTAAGWRVREHAVLGSWPRPAGPDRGALARVLADLPDGAAVLLDGLAASAAPEVLRPHAHRLCLVIIVHMALCSDAEGEALAAARAIIATSTWTRRLLLARYPLAPDRVHVATPGVDPAPLAPGSPDGSALLCVAAVVPGKGHDLLAEALASTADLAWDCVCAGPLDRDPGFVDRVRRRAKEYGIDERMCLVGPRTGGELDHAYAGADLLVLASRGETYGMVAAEALARGIPVLATDVGGLPEALGRTRGGGLPGLLVGAEDPAALAGALRRWLTGPALRRRLRRSAQIRREVLTGWPETSAVVSRAIDQALRSGGPVS